MEEAKVVDDVYEELPTEGPVEWCAEDNWLAQTSIEHSIPRARLCGAPASRVRVSWNAGSGTRAIPPAPWLHPTLNRLVELLDLPADWDGAGAGSVTRSSVDAALYLLGRIMKWSTAPPAVVPTSSGGIQLEWHERSADLVIEVESMGEMHVVIIDPASNLEWEGRLADAEGHLDRLISRLS